jgi:hypothetical protein
MVMDVSQGHEPKPGEAFDFQPCAAWLTLVADMAA